MKFLSSSHFQKIYVKQLFQDRLFGFRYLSFEDFWCIGKKCCAGGD